MYTTTAEGIVEGNASVEGFWEVFVVHMRSHNTPGVYGCQRLTFTPSKTDI